MRRMWPKRLEMVNSPFNGALYFFPEQIRFDLFGKSVHVVPVEMENLIAAVKSGKEGYVWESEQLAVQLSHRSYGLKLKERAWNVALYVSPNFDLYIISYNEFVRKFR